MDVPLGPLLLVDNLCVGYGDVQVLWDVSLEIQAGEIVALVGSNGAGKSTLLWTLSGLLRPRSGQICFDGEHLEKADAQKIVDLGIAHVPEGRKLFSAMSVLDNLKMGAYRRKDIDGVKADLARVLDMFPRLKDRLNGLAGKLSGGEQQMVAIARALMARPRLLLVDELSLGLAPLIIESLVNSLAQINQDGLTMLIVEQDVQVALQMATRAYVLESGHITLSGNAQGLLSDERIKRAYLGL